MGRDHRPGALGREITVVLIVKAMALAVLWLAFFRAPADSQPRHDPQRVADHLVAPTHEAAP